MLFANLESNFRPKMKASLDAFFAVFYGLHYISLFLYSVAFGIGSRRWNLTYLDPSDLWADFTKYISSFAGNSESFVPISSWPVFKAFDSAYAGYLENGSPYSNDPSEISLRLSHFHMPPFSIFIGKLFHALSSFWGPSTVYFVLVSLLVVTTCFLCLHTFSGLSIPKYQSILFLLSILISYPAQFAFFKGNTGALISSFLIIISTVLVLKDKVYAAFFVVLIASLNRPNYVFLLCLLAPFVAQKFSIRFPQSRIPAKYLSPFVAFLFFLLINSSLQALLSFYDPRYTGNNFSVGLSTYHTIMAHGDSGIAFGSSLLSVLKLIYKFVFYGDFSVGIPENVYNQFYLFVIVVGLLISVWFVFQYIKGVFDLSAAWLAVSSASLIITPVFADYHLTFLFSSVVLLIGFSARRKPPLAKFAALYELRIPSSLFYIAFLLAPLQIYLAPSKFPWGLGVVIRPLAACLFLFFIVVRSNIFLAKPRHVVGATC